MNGKFKCIVSVNNYECKKGYLVKFCWGLGGGFLDKII